MFKADSPLVDFVFSSPNGRERKASEKVTLIVLHGTWMKDDVGAVARLCDPATEVSCHYYIMRHGEIAQLTPEARVAWHAGKSVWEGVEGVNAFSLGIEIGNGGDGTGELAPYVSQVEPYYPHQYLSLIQLLKELVQRYPGVKIVGHDQISPGRKTDPGAHFDWSKLLAAGLPVARE